MTSCGAFFQSGSLCKFIVIDFDVVDNDFPLFLGVDGPQDSNIIDFSRTKVSFFVDSVESIYTVVCIGIRNISVKFNKFMFM